MASIPKWQSLTAVPIKTDDINYFPIIIDHYNKQLYAIDKENGILKYSFDANRWNCYKIVNLAALPSTFFYDASISTAIDSQQRMYLCTSDGHLATLQIDSPSPLKLHIVDTGRDLLGTRAIMIKNELHIIGGDCDHGRDYKHLKLNTRTGIASFDAVCDQDLGWPQLIKIKDKLFSFGGHRGSEGYLDEIHEYDIQSKKWMKTMYIMPREMIVDGISCVLNQQFILLFGGYDGITNIRKIWLYSMKHKVFKESKVECPGNRGGQVFTINDPKQDELAVFGYIRSQWSKCQIYAHLFPPRYLIKIMSKYYMNEWIYLIEDKGQYWKIDVFDIINNVQD